MLSDPLLQRSARPSTSRLHKNGGDPEGGGNQLRQFSLAQ
jgi:hypothetical protein